jgi:hypothetical protein
MPVQDVRQPLILDRPEEEKARLRLLAKAEAEADAKAKGLPGRRPTSRRCAVLCLAAIGHPRDDRGTRAACQRDRAERHAQALCRRSAKVIVGITVANITIFIPSSISLSVQLGKYFSIINGTLREAFGPLIPLDLKPGTSVYRLSRNRE